MPIYEYVCGRCDLLFEKLVLSSSEEILCPQCNSGEVKKQFSVFGFSSDKGFRSSASSASCSACTSKTCSSCG